ncbi:MAG: respiratory chain complex I subunit 1 family protein [Burkholderiales bacterium]
MTGIFTQLMQSLLVVTIAPLFVGWVNCTRAWLQNRRAAGVLQPYRDLHKLFIKEAVLADNASRLFRTAPYILFGAMWLAAGIVPVIAVDLPFAPAADAIALVGLFALARVAMALAAMDIGTAFGHLGARREMMVAFLAEPALLMTFFTASLISHSTSLTTIVNVIAHTQFTLYASMAFAAIAFLLVLLAENARIPVDNPATHLELTMIHEAMVLEYSARHLALIEWASGTKLLVYVTIGIALFAPWGIAQAGAGIGIAFAALALKLTAAGAGLALLETLLAKLRLFRVPELMATAFLLSMIGLLTHFLLEVQ